MISTKTKGVAGEHFACYDSFLLGIPCYFSDESQQYDLLMDYNKVLKVQVKASNKGSKRSIRFNPNTPSKSNYDTIDLFAFVWLDGGQIAWLPRTETNIYNHYINKTLFQDYTLERALSMIESR